MRRMSRRRNIERLRPELAFGSESMRSMVEAGREGRGAGSRTSSSRNNSWGVTLSQPDAPARRSRSLTLKGFKILSALAP
eukprot:947306-Pyramimonas_sp.AAC.1